ncbi:MAG: S-adenosylmethionine:tRNA ribosyltransferase-isomerase [Bacteroidetes bacterium]|nr:S-adenosylmethionine:tRNA ribosyltransferase-isomerase [Bacteroidota bacterium]
MQHPFAINIDDFNYILPEEKIAKFPLANRSDSKLLCAKGMPPESRKFTELPDLLPAKSLLVFNETKVVRARLLFKKNTGAVIEIFCLEPVTPVNDFQLAFQQKSDVEWKCLVGKAKRWKSEALSRLINIEDRQVKLKAEKVATLSEGYLIRFSWDDPEVRFHEIIEAGGLVPLPPYLNREAEPEDSIRYQTVYAKFEGSVAAPTAGLHFTPEIFEALQRKGHQHEKVTLHVGAGTFKPVSSQTLVDHEMHIEKIEVSLSTLKTLAQNTDRQVIAVGTTSMRTLESLFWMAVRLFRGDKTFAVEQWDPYQPDVPVDFGTSQALNLLVDYLEANELAVLQGQTQLIIAPGYQFRVVNGLITNFHQPKSTLLLLVSALIGENWKTAYDFALKNDFRFLSYGDSCLFLPEPTQSQ